MNAGELKAHVSFEPWLECFMVNTTVAIRKSIAAGMPLELAETFIQGICKDILKHAAKVESSRPPHQ